MIPNTHSFVTLLILPWTLLQHQQQQLVLGFHTTTIIPTTQNNHHPFRPYHLVPPLSSLSSLSNGNSRIHAPNYNSIKTFLLLKHKHNNNHKRSPSLSLSFASRFFTSNSKNEDENENMEEGETKEIESGSSMNKTDDTITTIGGNESSSNSSSAMLDNDKDQYSNISSISRKNKDIKQDLKNAILKQENIPYAPDDKNESTSSLDDTKEDSSSSSTRLIEDTTNDQKMIDIVVATNEIKIKKKQRFWNRIFSKKEKVSIISIPSEDVVEALEVSTSSSTTNQSSIDNNTTSPASDDIKQPSENTNNITTLSSSSKQKPISKFRKRLFTTVSIVVCLFLAAPAPKRFTLQDNTQGGDSSKYTIATSKLLDETKRSSPIPSIKKQQSLEEEGEQEEEKMPSSSKQQAQQHDSNPSNHMRTTPKSALPPYYSSFGNHNNNNNRLSATSFVADAVKKIGPSVVRIDTESYVTAASTSSSPFDFYEDDEDNHNEGPSNRIIKSGQGSGIIFSKDGLVLTNAHVVDDASRVYVTLTDGRKFVAEVKGVDEMVDIAVLKILCHSPWGGYAPWGGTTPNTNNGVYPPSTSSTENTNTGKLPVAALGNSDNLQVGEFVIAVGNPAGLDNSVTMGIVSSLKRSSEEIGLPGTKVSFIQTDAAVNPGNSGGPLVNEHGEIIGINTCIRANMEGIAFAIPINKAKDIMYQLAEGENIKHGYIGVVMMTITPDFARQNNMDPNSPVGIIPEVNGVMIERVLSNTPAAIAGLRRFDIILQINGKDVHSASDAASIVDAATVGQDLELKILRLSGMNGNSNKPVIVYVNPADLGEKLRQRKETKRMQEGGNSGGGRIYVLPFPNSP